MLMPRLILKVSRKESSRICLLSFPLTLPLILTRPNTGPGLSSNFDLNKSTWSRSLTHKDHDSQKKKPGLRFIRPVDAVPLQGKHETKVCWSKGPVAREEGRTQKK